MEVLLNPLKTLPLLLVVSGLAFGQAIAPCSAISPNAAMAGVCRYSVPEPES